MRDYLTKNYGTGFEATFGKKTGKAMIASCAGRLNALINNYKLSF